MGGGAYTIADKLDWYDLEHEDQEASWQLSASAGTGPF
jgi:hypothetical protein